MLRRLSYELAFTHVEPQKLKRPSCVSYYKRHIVIQIRKGCYFIKSFLMLSMINLCPEIRPYIYFNDVLKFKIVRKYKMRDSCKMCDGAQSNFSILILYSNE